MARCVDMRVFLTGGDGLHRIGGARRAAPRAVIRWWRIGRDREKVERLNARGRHGHSRRARHAEAVPRRAATAPMPSSTPRSKARRAASRRIGRRSTRCCRRSKRAPPTASPQAVHLHVGRVGARQDHAGRPTKTRRSIPPPHVAWRPAHEQLVLDAGDNGAAHRSSSDPASSTAARAASCPTCSRTRSNGLVRVIGTGQEPLAVRLRPRPRRISTCGCCSRRTRAGSSTPTTKPTSASTTSSKRSPSTCRRRPDIRHVPLPEARRKLGTYADALALDQRVRSPRARALGWSPTLSSIAANVPRLFEEFRPRADGRLAASRLQVAALRSRCRFAASPLQVARRSAARRASMP